jgi:hypothetical protein
MIAILMLLPMLIGTTVAAFSDSLSRHRRTARQSLSLWVFHLSNRRAHRAFFFPNLVMAQAHTASFEARSAHTGRGRVITMRSDATFCWQNTLASEREPPPGVTGVVAKAGR